MNEIRKKVIRKISIGFIILLLFFTFFSNTINNIMLPLVTVEKSENGSLVKTLSASGKIAEKDSDDIYADPNLKVQEVEVKEGDTVKKGQEMMVLDSTDLENQLKDENAMLEQKQINLSNLKDANSAASLLTFDNNIELARQKLQDAQEKYDEVKDQSSQGQATSDMVTAAENDLQNAKTNLDMAQNAKNKSINDNQSAVDSANLDIQMEQRKIEDLNKQIEDCTIKANEDGTVEEVNFTKNSMTNTAKPAVKISCTDEGYSLTVTTDSDNAALVKDGMEIDVSLDDKNTIVKGTVESIIDNTQLAGDKKDIVIDLKAAGISNGDNASINISSKTKPYMVLVPIEAVNEDNSGDYVFVIKQNKGPLGDENFVQKVNVTVEDYDNTKCAVSGSISPLNKIVTSTDKALSDGDKVRIDD